MAPTQATQARSTRWSLEVVRGRDVGRVFDLAGGEVVLGNAARRGGRPGPPRPGGRLAPTDGGATGGARDRRARTSSFAIWTRRAARS